MARLSRKPEIVDFSPAKEEEIVSLVESYGDILAFYLFGSYLTPFFTSLSDLDFALLPLPEIVLSREKEAEILSECSRIVGSEDVSLLNLRTTPLTLTIKVLQEGKLLFCRNGELLADFVERTIKFYGDWAVDEANIHQDFDYGLREEFVGD